MFSAQEPGEQAGPGEAGAATRGDAGAGEGARAEHAHRRQQAAPVQAGQDTGGLQAGGRQGTVPTTPHCSTDFLTDSVESVDLNADQGRPRCHVLKTYRCSFCEFINFLVKNILFFFSKKLESGSATQYWIKYFFLAQYVFVENNRADNFVIRAKLRDNIIARHPKKKYIINYV